MFVLILFRVREKGNGSFALSISYRGTTKHYRIDRRKTSTGERLAIEDGPQFENLMDVRAVFMSRYIEAFLNLVSNEC